MANIDHSIKFSAAIESDSTRPDYNTWLATAKSERLTDQIYSALLQLDDVQLTEKLRQMGEDLATELLVGAMARVDTAKNTLQVYEMVEARLMVAASRVCAAAA